MRTLSEADEGLTIEVGGRQRQPGHAGHVGHQAHLDGGLRQDGEDAADVLVAAEGQGDEDVGDVVLLDQLRQLVEPADDVDVARQLAVLLLDEADVLDAQPADAEEGARQPAGVSAGADDEGEGLVVAPAPQVADDAPADAAHGEDAARRQDGEDDHGGARLVRVVLEEDGGHREQR